MFEKSCLFFFKAIFKTFLRSWLFKEVDETQKLYTLGAVEMVPWLRLHNGG